MDPKQVHTCKGKKSEIKHTYKGKKPSGTFVFKGEQPNQNIDAKVSSYQEVQALWHAVLEYSLITTQVN